MDYENKNICFQGTKFWLKINFLFRAWLMQHKYSILETDLYQNRNQRKLNPDWSGSSLWYKNNNLRTNLTQLSLVYFKKKYLHYV